MSTKTILPVLFLAAVTMCRAQLAITEAMSSASTNLGTTLVAQNSDWWELSNFGTNTIDLSGYGWNDNSGGLIGADPTPFQGLSIGPGESIIFVEFTPTGSTNEAQFRAWWGNQLGAEVQIRFYTGNGMGSGGDGIRVWAPGAVGDLDVVDSVDFSAALRGVSFTYHTNTGAFGAFSTNGINGAFQAVTADDVGSPGVTTGTVPLSIAQSPTNLSVNPGDSATFNVTARGVPRARFQWRFNEADISGARFSALTVTNVQTSSTGRYDVIIFNGFQTLTSSVAVLSLNASNEPPTVLSPPANQTIYVGQSATFTIVASGVPQPTYQWRFNGTNIGGATSSSYAVNGAQLASAGTYSVVVSNALGALTNQATLAVTRRPDLRITEVLSAQSTNGAAQGHNDWWELTNFDDFAVDLFGYKFDDGSALRAAAYTFTNHIVIAPGESIVFVEVTSVSEFREWWGASNLKTNLQIVSYIGSALGFSSLGDGLLLWNPGAADDTDTIAAESFSTATAGVSFGYNPDSNTFGDLSVLGINGAFQASESGDLGSPGYIRTPSEPRLLRLVVGTSEHQITWYGLSGRTFAVEFKNDLADAGWLPLTNVVSTNIVTTASIPGGASPTGNRFYRLALVP